MCVSPRGGLERIKFTSCLHLFDLLLVGLEFAAQIGDFCRVKNSGEKTKETESEMNIKGINKIGALASCGNARSRLFSRNWCR